MNRQDKIAPPQNTAAKIIEVAIELMVEQQSPRHIEMVQVAAAAGISRTTLYRHFPTREALLEGVFETTIEKYQSGMMAALAARPGIEDRVPVFVDFLENWRVEGQFLKIYQEDAALMLNLTQRIIPSAVNIFLVVMNPLFDMAEVIHRQPLDRDAIAHMFVHFSISLILFPENHLQRNPRELMAAMINVLLQMPPKWDAAK